MRDEKTTELDKYIEFIQIGVELGYARVQQQLGLNYMDGTGVPKNAETAVKLFKEAAEQGYAPAQSDLGYCYLEGIGIPKNEKEGAKLLQIAKAQGNLTAQANLGECYLLLIPSRDAGIK